MGFFPADWRYRHAALMAISACGEGCHKQMELMLTDIVGAVLPFLQDQVDATYSLKFTSLLYSQK